MLEVNAKVRQLIYDGGNQDKIRDAALENGMLTLHDAAVEKMKQGVTTIREVIKLTVFD